MARILALDYGGKRTGIATTDPLQIIATPLTTVLTVDLMSFLEKHLKKEEVECLVVGQPIRHDGSFSAIEEKILLFIREFSLKFPLISVKRINEMYSSKEAMRSLVASGVPKNKRRDKKLLDSTSATLLLQEYLEFHR